MGLEESIVKSVEKALEVADDNQEIMEEYGTKINVLGMEDKKKRELFLDRYILAQTEYIECMGFVKRLEKMLKDIGIGVSYKKCDEGYSVKIVHSNSLEDKDNVR